MVVVLTWPAELFNLAMLKAEEAKRSFVESSLSCQFFPETSESLVKALFSCEKKLSIDLSLHPPKISEVASCCCNFLIPCRIPNYFKFEFSAKFCVKRPFKHVFPANPKSDPNPKIKSNRVWFISLTLFTMNTMMAFVSVSWSSWQFGPSCISVWEEIRTNSSTKFATSSLEWEIGWMWIRVVL